MVKAARRPVDFARSANRDWDKYTDGRQYIASRGEDYANHLTYVSCVHAAARKRGMRARTKCIDGGEKIAFQFVSAD